MNQFFKIVGPQEFVNKVYSLLESSEQIKGSININAELIATLSEVYKITSKTFNSVQVTEHHMRLFFSKMRRGTYAVKSGPILNSFQDLVNYYKTKVGDLRFGKHWTLDSFKKQSEELSTGVYLLRGLTNEETTELKTSLDSFFVVQAVPDTPKGKDKIKQKVEVLPETDVTIKQKENEDAIKREINNMLKKLQTKQKEKTNDSKPKFRITKREFRPWNS